MKKFKCAELVLDFGLYPRHNVDSYNIRSILDALDAGTELPPVIADEKSKRVADGFHRVRAYLKKYGPEAEINVIFKRYKNESELFLDAMRYNASHGAKLDQCDRTHCMIVAERLQIPLDAVAGALHMEVDKLANLRSTRTATANGLTVPIKRTIQHKAGQELTPQNVAGNEKLSGMTQTFYVNQLITLIESKLLNLEDDQLMERLKNLHVLLDDVLAATL